MEVAVVVGAAADTDPSISTVWPASRERRKPAESRRGALEDVMNFAADKARCRDENPQALSERC
ncbi:hypothetical protein, partial [Burkholderia ubonensis]|uniref:hypothetical protein n=1 Tax=Burkholderia ubonensis TaxID=101571 RepID=UPI001E56B0C3